MKVTAIVSAITGFFFGSIGYFVLHFLGIEQAFQVSAVCGLLFTLLLFPILVAFRKVTEKRYAKFEKEITSPVFYKTNGNFNTGNGNVKNGNIYFCESGIVCVCLDNKPYSLDEILLQDIERYQFDDIHLNIFTKNGRIFVITSPDAHKIIEILREKDWI